jgi:hypothetical protein
MTMISRRSRAFLAACALAGALLPSASVRAGGLEDALRKVPADAAGVVVAPSLKAASDDLQLALDRMGRAEAALGGRPIDLLKAQAGVGAGFDDRGSFVAWSQPRAGGFANAAAFAVTDADAFIAAMFDAAPEATDGAMRSRTLGTAVWVRKAGSHVLVADADVLGAWTEGDAFAKRLEERIGSRGMEIVRGSDLFSWASDAVMRVAAAKARTAAVLDEGVAGMLPRGDAPEAGAAAALEAAAKGRERSAAVLEQVTDGIVAVDFDALAVMVRGWARFAPGSEFAKAIPASAPGAAGRAATALLGKLPAGAPFLALGIDLEAMGGLKHLRTVLATMPQGDRLQLPEWLDRVQDKVKQVQVAAYPSKLAIMTGGFLNDSSMVVVTDDPAAVKAGLRSWVESQAWERGGLRSEPTWEEARTLKDGSTVTAFSVKETVTGPGPDATERLMKQLVLGTRGLHGFAREVPGALVVTYSQRTDVLGRATSAASGGAPALGAGGVVRAMSPWLVPDADLVAFVGVGQLLEAARQVASALPGGAAEMVPEVAAGLEPVAFAVRSKDATWEGAMVVPAGVLGAAFDVAKARARQ